MYEYLDTIVAQPKPLSQCLTVALCQCTRYLEQLVPPSLQRASRIVYGYFKLDHKSLDNLVYVWTIAHMAKRSIGTSTVSMHPSLYYIAIGCQQ